VYTEVKRDRVMIRRVIKSMFYVNLNRNDLSPIYTADADATQLDRCVASASADWALSNAITVQQPRSVKSSGLCTLLRYYNLFMYILPRNAL